MTEDLVDGPEAVDWLIVKVAKDLDAMTKALLEYAESVHIHGMPYAWFIKWLVTIAPNCRRIRVVPAYAHALEPDCEASKMLAERGISIEIGCGTNRKKVWRKDFVTASYRDKRYFMLYLDAWRKELLLELQIYAPEYLEITSRYLCLGGEKHVTIEELAREHNVSKGYIQDAVATVLYHLDSPFDTPLIAVQHARVLRERIAKGEEEKRQATVRKEKLRTLSLSESDLPEGMSFDLVDQYAFVFKAWQHDHLSESVVTPKERLVLVRRYGLQDKKFRTLEDVGQELGVTRERVRQIENVALKRIRDLLNLSAPSPS